MKFDSYIVSETRTAFSVPLTQEIPIKKSFKQKAFTLAETLITLSIIGVIAAMTVPTLMANINNQQHITALKKAYSNLSNAVKMLMVDTGCNNDFDCILAATDGPTYAYSSDGVDNGFIFALSKQFKTIKTEKSILVKMDENSYTFSDGYFTTEDGMNWMSYRIHDFGKMYYTGILLDTNGVKKGPNKTGKDVHHFLIAPITQNGIAAGTVIPWGSRLHENYKAFDYGSWENFGDNGRNRTGKVFDTNKIE